MADYQYLIVGNSAAGVAAIEAIRKLDHKGTIACVSDEDHPAYSTPMISYLLKGSTTLEKMHLRSAGFYEHSGVDCVFGSPVVSIDAKKKAVTLANGETLGFGKLLWAAGSVPSDNPVAGLEGSNVFPFLNLTDAQAVMDCIAAKRVARPGAPVDAVVIGSGLIGTKAAEGLTHLADSVTVLARSGSILRSIIDEDASALVERAFADNGVDIHLGTVATAAIVEDGQVVSLELNDGTTISADVVITAAGVKPNCAVPVAAGATAGRGLICDEHMQTSLRDVYAAGDAAQSHDVLDGRDKVIALWPDAIAQGSVAGCSMAGGTDTYEGGFALNAIGFFGSVSILTSGIVAPREESFDERIHSGDDGTYVKFVIKGDRLYGFILVNRPDGAGIYTSLIREGVSLSSMDETLFDRVPQMRDLPYTLRWPLMHKGFPVGKEA